MVLDLLFDPQVLRGVFFALIGVAFWVGGLVVANWLWGRLREDS